MRRNVPMRGQVSNKPKRNLTFGGAAEKVIGGDSGRSRAGTIDKDKPTVERQHPEAAYSRCRP